MRRPANAAGRLCPDDALALRGAVREALGARGPAAEGARVRALVAPAGPLEAVGAVAGPAYARVQVPPVAIVLAPSRGRSAIMSAGSWLLPGDEAPVAAAVAEELRASTLLLEEPSAFDDAWEIEVQLPLLRARNPLVEVVPVVVAAAPHSTCRRLGSALADVVVEFGRDVLLVAAVPLAVRRASTPASARGALEAALGALDAEALRAAADDDGPLRAGPATAVLEVVVTAARALGATSAQPVAAAHRATDEGVALHLACLIP